MTSAADQVDALVEAPKVINVAGNGYSVDDTGDEHYRRVDDVGGGGSGAQLSRSSSTRSVERVDHHALCEYDAHEPNLPGRVSPRLRQCASRHVDLVSKLEQPDDTAIASLDCD